MARIPETDLQRLKNEISVERLIASAGVELRRVGKDLAGRCPFHDDSEPSLIITPSKNLWHCFGCQCGGGVIDWVMKLRGVSFRHAVEMLKDDCALAAESSNAGQSVKRSTVRSLAAPVALDADDRALLVQVVAYYTLSLKQSPEALAYLQSRGLNHPELIDHFKLGFANRTLGLRLPDKRRVEGAQIRARLERLGVYRESGHEHFNGSLVVPVFDHDGQVAELYGRKVTSRLRDGTPLHLYLPANSARGRGVFNLAALVASKEIILCESIIDALTFWCAGFRNVTTAYGIEGLTDELVAAFKLHATARVLIAYDRDEAGERGAVKAAERLQAIGVECWRIEFPKGMDANEYALKVQPAAKSLGLLIRKAAWLGKGVAPSVVVKTPSVVGKPAERPAIVVESGESVQPVVESKVPVKQAFSPINTGASSYANNSDALPSLVTLAADSEPAQLPVQRVPDTPPEPVCGVSAQELTLCFGDGNQARRWRIRGWAKNLAFEVMKVNVLAACGQNFHVDSFDLYAARARASFIAQAALEMGQTGVTEAVLKSDLGRVLLKLEALQDEAVTKALEPSVEASAARVLSASEHASALALLASPDLPARILADFEAAGVVGEATNCLVGYLAAVSRKLDRPLAVVIQSSSAAGKSSLMDAILSFVPEEERVQYSAMTGQSLFYMGQTSLKHKILAIAEEEGAHRASYALKLLQSEGELTIASTGTDPATGNLITQEYKVEGPMSLFMTTTAIDIDEELMNRCLVLSVDEAREQTRAIHQLQRQRRTLAGLTKKHEKQAILTVHRNAQRLLRSLPIVNPYADQLTFLDERTRTRRDHEKYLTLIDTIALLHQHQRLIKTTVVAGQAVEYIEASLTDIALANKIAHEVLGTSLDELSPQTRRMLTCVHALVHAKMATQGVAQREVRFTRADLRAATGASDTQLKLHLSRLAELEYLLVHRALRGQGFVYELLYDGNGDHPSSVHLSGLIDVAALEVVALKAAPLKTQDHPHDYDAQRSALDGERSATGRGAVGGMSAPGRPVKNAASPHEIRLTANRLDEVPETRAAPAPQARASYLRADLQSYVQPLAA